MDYRSELTEFLRSRRARLKPAEVGLGEYGRRRVPGLRREELARLSNVSVDYYVRFEQGRAENVSDSVVDAVAAALRLNEFERTHLHNLSRSTRDKTSPRKPEEIRPSLQRLLQSISDTPAYVLGRRSEILGWNQLYAALLIDFGQLPVEDRNQARLVFLDDTVRSRYVDWETKARYTAAYLRLEAGGNLKDPEFDLLINDLWEHSADFRRIWNEQEVHGKTHGRIQMHHPVVGIVELAFESFQVSDDQEQTLIMYTAEAGSASEKALQQLVETIDGA